MNDKLNDERELYEFLHKRYPIRRSDPQDFLIENLILRKEVFIPEMYKILTRNPSYGKDVLKWLLKNSEWFNLNGAEEDWLSDWLNQTYPALLTSSKSTQHPMQQTDIIEYKISEAVTVLVKEFPHLISSRTTTGFRTWEAAVYLSRYMCLQATDIFERYGNRFLELGAGTGLVSLSLIKKFPSQIHTIFITDGDQALLHGSLTESLAMNGVNLKSDPSISLRKLRWNIDPIPSDKISVVFGADITFDDSLFEDLLICIKDILSKSSDHRSPVCFLSCTIRNKSTDREFRKACSISKLSYKLLRCTDTDIEGRLWLEERVLFHKLLAPIRIYEITNME